MVRSAIRIRSGGCLSCRQRDQIFAAAADTPVLRFDDFADNDACDATSQKEPLAGDTVCTLAA
jgi:hypothetical protein